MNTIPRDMLQYVWGMSGLLNIGPTCLFLFLLAITEVNVNLAEAYFVHHKAPRPQLEFRKLIAKDLINNEILMQEINKQKLRRSK